MQRQGCCQELVTHRIVPVAPVWQWTVSEPTPYAHTKSQTPYLFVKMGNKKKEEKKGKNKVRKELIEVCEA